MLCHSRKYAGTGARRVPFEERSSPPSSKVSPYGRNDILCCLSFPEVRRDRCSTSAFRGEIFTTIKQGFSLRSKRQIVCYVIPGSTPGQVFDERLSRRDLHRRQTRFLPTVETTNSKICLLDERPSRRDLHGHQARFLPTVETTNYCGNPSWLKPLLSPCKSCGLIFPRVGFNRLSRTEEGLQSARNQGRPASACGMGCGSKAVLLKPVWSYVMQPFSSAPLFVSCRLKRPGELKLQLLK